MRFKDKVAIVTGAASGIGRATAFMMAREGASVVIADINAAGAKEVAAEINKISKAVAVEANVAVAKDVDNMVNVCVEKFGKLNILVNNAGETLSKPLVKTTEEEWNRLVNVNLNAIFLCSKRAAPEIIKQGGGKIVNVSSIDGIVGGNSVSAYCASKGGAYNLTKQMGLEFISQKINVNGVAPGIVETGMTKFIIENPQFLTRVLADVPIGRVAKPDDIAETICFLASDAASYIVGHTIVVDGGWIAH